MKLKWKAILVCAALLGQMTPFAAFAKPLYGRDPPPYLQSIPQAEQFPVDRSVGPPEQGRSTKRFHRPGVEGMRLDWCLAPMQGCGVEAAQAFCQWHGYLRAVSVVEEQGVGLREPTRQIGTSRQCAGPNCSGFLAITCSKN